jgi:hypothetical protein
MKWKDPPARPITGKRGVWREEAAELRASPGRWALLATFGGAGHNQNGRSMAANIRKGRYQAFRPQGHFEATSASAPAGPSTEVYARYTGPGEEKS